MRLLLLGATGLVGGRTLKLALSNSAVSEVIAPTRKPLAPSDRLVNPVVPHLERLVPDLGSYGLDAVICALGTTQATAGSKEAFRYVDHDLPIAFGKAAHVLEAASADIEFRAGRFVIAGTDRSVGLMELAERIHSGLELPPEAPQSLDVSNISDGPPSAFPNGCHIAEVEVDPQTGYSTLASYSALDDSGE